METIARIYTDFPDKFGIPRQGSLAKGTDGRIIFEPKYRNPKSVDRLDEFSHIWVIWEFSEVDKDREWSPSVRPPKLGGNTRVGVFATRSPFRPNRIGLSSVKLNKIEYDKELGPVLYVSGADMVDGTPVYDIKPYIPYADCHTDAVGGFTEDIKDKRLNVVYNPDVANSVPQDILECISDILSVDPRPSYNDDFDRVYGMYYKEYNVKFSVCDDTLIIREIIKNPK